MEGIGGPVNVEQYSTGGIDPALEDCCRREVLGNRRQNALQSTLRRHDVAALAERRRRHLVTMPIGDSHHEACRCSNDPNSDGGEYWALVEFKERKRLEQNYTEQCDEETELKIAGESVFGKKSDFSDDTDNSDSDDEFDYLLDEDLGEDENLKQLEERRREELEYQMLMRQIAGYHGYGVHRQLHPSRVLRIAGLGRNAAESRKSSTPPPPLAVVLHMFDANSMASASLDYFFENKLAKEYPGTMFMRSDGRSVVLKDSSLAQKALPSNILQPDKAMPALLAIRDGVVVNTCIRLLGLATNDGEIESHAVRQWLDCSRVLLTETPIEEVCLIRPEEEAHMNFMRSKQQKLEQAPPAEEEYYNCGVSGCHKHFSHQHVGIQTSEQSGLVVQEETILEKG